MQAGRIVALQLEAETEGSTLDASELGVAPQAVGLAAKIQRALERRAARQMRSFRASVQVRDSRGRFE